jgi:serine/threonine protein kinase
MDKYHIYEEIGKGEFSQVFKGREKNKIEYVAIKRVEKEQMNKVSIQILSYFMHCFAVSYMAI